MSNSNHAHVMAFLNDFHVGGTPDFAKLSGYFSEDGWYQPLVPATSKIVGRTAIAAALEKQYQTYHECRCEIHASAATDRFVFTEHIAIGNEHIVIGHRATTHGAHAELG